MSRGRCEGMTLVEVALGAVTLAIVLAAILGAYVGQVALNEHSRNLSLAIQDANRVMDQIRQQNSPCAAPPAPDLNPPGGGTWDAWLAAGGGGKSRPPNLELVQRSSTPGPPIQVTVAVCWRDRNRTVGECSWNGVNLTANNPAINSPAKLTTLITCRQS
ncbi:MAG: type II secretion system protein [Candidatus Omnitrophica bacterium]|nr:type II secretion system protein [Candidatus Omnitrophota bacterium]